MVSRSHRARIEVSTAFVLACNVLCCVSFRWPRFRAPLCLSRWTPPVQLKSERPNKSRFSLQEKLKKISPPPIDSKNAALVRAGHFLSGSQHSVCSSKVQRTTIIWTIRNRRTKFTAKLPLLRYPLLWAEKIGKIWCVCMCLTPHASHLLGVFRSARAKAGNQPPKLEIGRAKPRNRLATERLTAKISG